MKHARLFYTAFWIACKHSSRGLLCLLCVWLVCGGLLGGVVGAAAAKAKEQPLPPMRVAVVNLDDNPMTAGILQSLGGQKEFAGLAELVFYTDRTAVEDARCIITIPQGFLDSVMNGENRSPTVEYDASGVMESLWARQLAVAGARALSAAQRGVYAVQESVDYGGWMDEKTYGMLLGGINMELMRAFLTRDGVVRTQTVYASGTPSLPRYYLAAAFAAFVFGYGFLFYPAVEGLTRFSRDSRRGMPVFGALFLHMLAFGFVVACLVFALFAGGFSWAIVSNAGLFSLLSAAFSLLFCLLFSSRAACTAGCILFTAGMALCGGLLIPLALMPQSFAAAASFLPLVSAMELTSLAFTGETLPVFLLLKTIGFVGAMLAGAAVLWRVRTGTGGQG